MRQVADLIHEIAAEVEAVFMFEEQFSLMRDGFWVGQRLPEEETCQAILRQIASAVSRSVAAVGIYRCQ